MLVFESNTAEEFRAVLVDYIEGLISIEELKLCHKTLKREQQETEARRDMLIVLSDNLKGAELKGKG